MGRMPSLTTTRSSTVRVFESCKRRWALQHVRGDKLTSAAMDWGTEMHEHLENWYKHGIPPPNTATGRAARLSLKHLPPRGANLQVEYKWQALDAAVPYTGAMDLCSHEPLVRIWDHKSTAGIQWIKTVNELEQDISANAYALALMRQTGSPSVYCRWVYTTRDAKHSLPVDFTITREMAEERWEKTRNNVEEMCEIAIALDEETPLVVPPTTLTAAAMAVEPTLSHCDEYGGCPYRDMCHPATFSLPPPKKSLKIVTEENPPPMSALLSKLKAQLSAPQAAAAVTDPVNPPDAAPHNTPAPQPTTRRVGPAVVGKIHDGVECVVVYETGPLPAELLLMAVSTKQILLELQRRNADEKFW